MGRSIFFMDESSKEHNEQLGEADQKAAAGSEVSWSVGRCSDMAIKFIQVCRGGREALF
jgi:hypothetical protein